MLLKEYFKIANEFGFYVLADGKRELNLNTDHAYGHKTFTIGKKYYPVYLVDKENFDSKYYLVNKTWFSEDDLELDVNIFEFLGNCVSQGIVPVFMKSEITPEKIILLLHNFIKTFNENDFSYAIDKLTHAIEFTIYNYSLVESMKKMLDFFGEYYYIKYIEKNDTKTLYYVPITLLCIWSKDNKNRMIQGFGQ